MNMDQILVSSDSKDDKDKKVLELEKEIASL